MRTTYDKIYDGIYVVLWMLLAFGVGLSIGHGLIEKEKPDGPEKKPDGVIVLFKKQDVEEPKHG